jgi:hypothetical protein
MITGRPAQSIPSGLDSSIQMLQSQNREYGTSLMQQYNIEAGALEQQYMTDEQFTGRRASLQAKYQGAFAQREFAVRQSTQSIQRIREMVAKGTMDARAGEQAAWKMVLEPEAYTAQYPKTTTEDPMSSAAIRSATSLMGEFALGAEEKRGLEWGKPKRTASSLIDQYAAWQDQVGYDQLDPMHQQQLDTRWDTLMRGDKRFSSWFSDKQKKKPIAEVKSLRSRGPIGREMSKRFVQKSPRAVDSPVGTSIRKTMVKQSGWFGKKQPSPEELNATGSEAAYEQGVKLGYWK